MLRDQTKKEIQQLYTRWLASHDFKPRYGQRLMIAEIAKTLGKADPMSSADQSERFCVVEAGTGIGKTVAYTLAALPVAKAQEKTLVISTATVALQEQLVNKDLPDLIKNADFPFTFALAKGRGRYLCLSKLDAVLSGSDEQSGFLALYPDEQADNNKKAPVQLYQSMSEAILSGEWNGDRDDWQEPVEEQDWRILTSDRSQCHNRRCSYVSDCCFFKSRESLHEVDCIVTNHDLVLADLALGGGAILPEPEECMFVFDEAHHLADKAVQHFSSNFRLNASMRWFQQLGKTLDMVQQQWPGAANVARNIEQVDRISTDLIMFLQQLPEFLQAHIDQLEPSRWDSRGSVRSRNGRFQVGEVPDGLMQLASECEQRFSQLGHHLSAVSDEMQQSLESADADAALLEQWFPLIGAGVNRASNAEQLFKYYANEKKYRDPPRAFWMSLVELDSGSDYGLFSAPLLAASYLEELLWSRCAAAVLTSATLTALGSFERLIMRSGISRDAQYFSIASPFDYQNHAVLKIPPEACNPSDNEQHTEAIARYIESLPEKGGILVLFSSRRQMFDVNDALSASTGDLVLLQDDRSKHGLLDEHMRRVDSGERSIIFGLASFAEGVDLRGDYCQHVVIAKIPFAVPDDPVEEALSEWVSAQGKNAFMEISVPDAALKLVQACGRLLRSEADTGTVSLLDRRVVEKRYGRELLDSLPPFAREISPQERRNQ